MCVDGWYCRNKIPKNNHLDCPDLLLWEEIMTKHHYNNEVPVRDPKHPPVDILQTPRGRDSTCHVHHLLHPMGML